MELYKTNYHYKDKETGREYTICPQFAYEAIFASEYMNDESYNRVPDEVLFPSYERKDEIMLANTLADIRGELFLEILEDLEQGLELDDRLFTLKKEVQTDDETH